MVSVLRQTRSELSASYVLERHGAAICTAEMPFRLLNPSLQILRGGGVWASSALRHPSADLALRCA